MEAVYKSAKSAQIFNFLRDLFRLILQYLPCVPAATYIKERQVLEQCSFSVWRTDHWVHIYAAILIKTVPSETTERRAVLVLFPDGFAQNFNFEVTGFSG